MARTIDDLGMDAYSKYAEDKAATDETLLQESKFAPRGAEKDVTLPSFPSEFDLLLKTNERNQPWAAFFSPTHYHEQKKRVFRFQLIPSLGSEEKQASQQERIKEKAEKDEEHSLSHPATSWEEERDREEEKKEKEILLKLLSRVHILEKDLIDIYSRRNQYQKG